jgi:peroxiredoxin
MTPAPGRPAPSFSLAALGGGAVAIPDPAGRPALVAFFKDDCPTCRFTFPFLQRLHEQLGERALVAGVSQDPAPRAAAWSKDLGLSFPIAVDGTGYPVSAAYGLRAVPTICLLDGSGGLLRVAEGFGREALQGMADDLAARAGAPRPALYREGETIPPLKPG